MNYIYMHIYILDRVYVHIYIYIYILFSFLNFFSYFVGFVFSIWHQVEQCGGYPSE